MRGSFVFSNRSWSQLPTSLAWHKKLETAIRALSQGKKKKKTKLLASLKITN